MAEIEVSADSWFEVATDYEIDEMFKNILECKGCNIGNEMIDVLVRHLEKHELEGVPKFKQNDLIKKLYNMKI